MNNMNKKTYMLPGDERIVAGNAEEFVHELRVGSWMDSDCTDEQYMCNFAPILRRNSYPISYGQDMQKKYNGRLSFIITVSPFSFQGKVGIFYRNK